MATRQESGNDRKQHHTALRCGCGCGCTGLHSLVVDIEGFELCPSTKRPSITFQQGT
jgi:hypothetical protein